MAPLRSKRDRTPLSGKDQGGAESESFPFLGCIQVTIMIIIMITIIALSLLYHCFIIAFIIALSLLYIIAFISILKIAYFMCFFMSIFD